MQKPESKSISFDRAVSFYDRTRGYPPGIANRIADSLIERLASPAKILEIGIGTGRIAKPFLQRGLSVAGIDLSAAMMDSLLKTLPADSPRPLLAQADAAQLPLAAALFDAVIAVHVFHLIAGWQAALGEVRRVLRPAGSLLVGNDDGSPDSRQERMIAQWQRIITARYPQYSRTGVNDLLTLKETLLLSGARLEEWVAANWVTINPLGRYIDSIEQRIYSSTWQIPDEVLPPAVAELRLWATQEFGSLDQSVPAQRRFTWQRYRWS